MAGVTGTGAPASTIFVGNLAYDLSEQDVVDYFAKVGPVKSVRIVLDRDTGKPRGFGFIEFYDIPTAESAVRNLNGSDLNGRTLRIVFAEGGPGDFRPRREDDRTAPGSAPQGGMLPGSQHIDHRARRAANRQKVVGGDLAYHSSQGMSVLLGQPDQPNAPADQLTLILARKTRSELYEYLSQMQALLAQHPHQARQLLIDSPQLARALFQMEIILGMVSNPLGDVAPKGAAPPNLVTAVQQHQQQYAMPMPPPPPPMQQQAPVVVVTASDPRLGGGRVPAADPRLMAAGGPMGGVAPRPMVSVASQQSQQQQAVVGAPPARGSGGSGMPVVPGMTTEQQQALLQQVMSLTPEQIELLPAEQKAQVLALQQQLGNR